MSTAVDQAYAHEMREARTRFARGEFEEAFRHLERAHILGQRHTWRHVESHVWMLRVGWAERRPKEVVGQVFRIPAALLFSRLWVPVGNTGGANVSAFMPMPVPEDLAAHVGGRKSVGIDTLSGERRTRG